MLAPAMIKYLPEFKTFSYMLVKRGARVSWVAEALGASTKTVWCWVVDLRGSKMTRKGWRRKFPCRQLGGYVAPHLKGKLKLWGCGHVVEPIREAFRRLLRWIYFRDHGGFLDLEACLDGEEPP